MKQLATKLFPEGLIKKHSPGRYYIDTPNAHNVSNGSNDGNGDDGSNDERY